jgi:hypothetical protein
VGEEKEGERIAENAGVILCGDLRSGERVAAGF